jgi:hypothetical protein
MKPKFLLNLLGNHVGKVYSYSLNKQLLLLISIITIFCPFIFLGMTWGSMDTNQKLDLIKAIFIYYGSITGILVGAYSYNKVRQNGNNE